MEKGRLSKKDTISSTHLFDRTILVDFDGTIAEMVEFPKIGEPISGVKEAFHKLRRAGFVIVISTGRTNCFLPGQTDTTSWMEVIKWLYKQEIEWDELDLGRSGKFPAKYIIDDRMISMDRGWRKTVGKILI